MKNIFDNLRILSVILLFLFTAYFCVDLIDVWNWNSKIPVEIAMVAVSAIIGVIMTPIASIFIKKGEYKKYIFIFLSIFVILLVITWKLWFSIEWKQEPQFFSLCFLIPAAGIHFTMLYFLYYGYFKRK